jgi:predicted ATPase
VIFLRSITWKAKPPPPDSFPFSLPIFQTFSQLEFTSPVTFFVGENGSGKSTLLEAIAAGMGSVAIGSSNIYDDETLAHARTLARQLRFVRNRNPQRGFFFRAEDMFGFTKQVKRQQDELRDMEADFGERLSGYGRDLAVGATQGQRFELDKKYGANPDAKSHGESFLEVFQARLVPQGLYLLDEPETPLSPLRQLTLLSILKQMVAQDCQFIIATHSPMLMAFPEATIFNFADDAIEPTPYDEVEHVSLMRSFLNYPEMFLKRL